MRAKIYKGDETDDLLVQKFLDYGISVNSKNNQGMTPLHVHLENWDGHSWTTSVHKRLEERFHERYEMPLLYLFRRYVSALLPEYFPLEVDYLKGSLTASNVILDTKKLSTSMPKIPMV